MNKFAVTIILSAAILLAFHPHHRALGQISDPRLCSTQGDPVAAAPFNLVDAYCIPPTNPIGTPGEVATIAGSGTFRTNASGQLDVFIIWEPDQFGTSPGEQFTYSSSLSWAADKPEAVYKEWVGNFTLPGGPQAFMTTNSSNPDLTPPHLLLTGTSGTITDRTIPHDAFPPVPLGRYYIQVTGLDPFVDVDFATNLNNLASLYVQMERYEDAEPLHKQFVKIRRTALGEDHPAFAVGLNNLAELYRLMGRYAEAEPLYKQSIEITVAALGEDHPDFADSLNNLASLYNSMGRYEEAEPLYKQSTEIRRRTGGVPSGFRN